MTIARSLLETALPVGLSLFLYSPFIRLMQRLSWGQEIRPEGPEDHLSKKGTPTMGGAVLITTLLTVFAWSGTHDLPLLVLVAVTLFHAGLGAVDDYTKIAKKRSLGLKARQKLVAQIAIGAFVGIFAVWYAPHAAVWLPFAGWTTSPVVRVLLAAATVVGASNALNLTDGLDGLAAGTSISAFLAYAVICCSCSLPGLALACRVLVGACAGFLWFNAFPARVFMGDTGSLALGAALGTVAVLTHTEFLLFVIGGVFALEAISVMTQVSVFKLSRGRLGFYTVGQTRRVFRMSPIHHHFCKGGLHEVQVTTRMWIASAGLAILGITVYFLHFAPR